MTRRYVEPSRPLLQPACRVAFVILTPAHLVCETHWYGSPFADLRAVMEQALDLARLRGDLLPEHCTLAEVRVSLEREHHDSLTLSEGLYQDGTDDWGGLSISPNGFPVRFYGGEGGTSFTLFGAIPRVAVTHDGLRVDALPQWSAKLNRYLEALTGQWQWPAGTWGWWGLDQSSKGVERHRIGSITAAALDPAATVTTLDGHGLATGDVVRIGRSPFATQQLPVNRLWTVTVVDETTVTLDDFPAPVADQAAGVGGYMRKVQLSFHPYGRFLVGSPNTRKRRPAGTPYSFEIVEEPYRTLLNPGCYALCCLSTKHSFKSKARIFRDDDAEVTLRWFPVPIGQPFLPTPHLFGGRPWRYDRNPPTLGVGELCDTREVYEKDTPPRICWDWLGSDEWWAKGLLLDDQDGPVERRPGQCLDVFEPVYEGHLDLDVALLGVVPAGVITPCCPGVVLGYRLYMSWQGYLTGAYYAPDIHYLPGHAFLDYNPGDGRWHGSGYWDPAEPFTLCDFSFGCDPPYWTVRVVRRNQPLFNGSGASLTGTCVPFVQPIDWVGLHIGFAEGFGGIVIQRGDALVTGTLALDVGFTGKFFRGELALDVGFAGVIASEELVGELALDVGLAGEYSPVAEGDMGLELELFGAYSGTYPGALDLDAGLDGSAAFFPNGTAAGTLALDVFLRGLISGISEGALGLDVSLDGSAAESVHYSAGSLDLDLLLDGSIQPPAAGTLDLDLTLTGTAAVALAGTLALDQTLTGTPAVALAGSLGLDLALTAAALGVNSYGGGTFTTYTVPAGGQILTITLIGAGVTGANGGGVAGAGGGGGACAVAADRYFAAGATIQIMSGRAVFGSTGESSQLNPSSLLIAHGGDRSIAHATASGTWATSTWLGGAGAAGASGNGGGGGGSAGPAADGNDGTGTVGGVAVAGGGAGGHGGVAGPLAPTAGTQPGGGGGGGGTLAGNSVAAAGAAGRATIALNLMRAPPVIAAGTLGVDLGLAGTGAPRLAGTLGMDVSLAGLTGLVDAGTLGLDVSLTGQTKPSLVGSLDLDAGLAGTAAPLLAGRLDVDVGLSAQTVPGLVGSLDLDLAVSAAVIPAEPGSLFLDLSFSGITAQMAAGSLDLDAGLTGTAAARLSGTLGLDASLTGTASQVRTGTLGLDASLTGAFSVKLTGTLDVDVSMTGTQRQPITVTQFVTSGSSFTLDSTWNPSNNRVICLGAGGGSGSGSPLTGGQPGAGGGAGEGGACSYSDNVPWAASSTQNCGVGGSAAATNGGDTWAGGTNYATSTVGAKGGAGGANATGANNAAGQGVAGSGRALAANGIGQHKQSGGSGTTSAGGSVGGGGGGGAAGLTGNGRSGAAAVGAGSGGGGGGANGGTASTTGVGGVGRGGGGAGSAGNPGGTGTNGGGGGGGVGANATQANLTGGAGGQDTLWTQTSDGATAGPSGGAGGGALNITTGASGGNGKKSNGYGGGAGAGAGSGAATGQGVGVAGDLGLIVLIWTY